MTAVTQKIRRFSGGISDQPDEQKIPGQVRDALNCVPDVVQGLTKRPGMNLIADANTTADGKWFFINKNNPVTKNERYVGQINNETGKVKMWDLFTGKPQNVCYADNIDPLDIRSTPGGFQIPPGYTAQFSCEGEPGQDHLGDDFCAGPDRHFWCLARRSSGAGRCRKRSQTRIAASSASAVWSALAAGTGTPMTRRFMNRVGMNGPAR